MKRKKEQLERNTGKVRAVGRLGQTVERRFEHLHGKLVVQSKRALILEFSRRERSSRPSPFTLQSLSSSMLKVPIGLCATRMS